MPEKLDEILAEVRELKSKVGFLSTKLYGENGFEGDIPEIRKVITNHTSRIRKIELIIAGLIGSGVLTGGTIGIIRLLG